MLPLRGVKVMDLTHAGAGPCCTMLLADMGAEIVKVEPIEGDHFRYLAGGATFVNLNCNKRDLAIDLKSQKGLEIALRLASRSDVLVESFTPGTIDNLGLGYDRITIANPAIIYCSISGFGQTGPYRQRPGYDPIAQAMSGIMMATGEADRPPSRITPSTIDYGTGFLGAYGIAAALFDRQRNGKGQKIDVSLLDTAVYYMNTQITNYFMTGRLPSRMGSASVFGAPYQAFRTKDRPVFIAVINDRAWTKFCNALGLLTLASDPQFSTLDDRLHNREKLVEKLNSIFEQLPSEEILQKLISVDIPCSPLLGLDDVVSHPQVIAREMIMDADYPGTGKTKIARSPIMVGTTRGGGKFEVPPLGKHTNEILAELGYSEAEISKLCHSGTVLQYEELAR